MTKLLGGVLCALAVAGCELSTNDEADAAPDAVTQDAPADVEPDALDAGVDVDAYVDAWVNPLSMTCNPAGESACPQYIFATLPGMGQRWVSAFCRATPDAGRCTFGCDLEVEKAMCEHLGGTCALDTAVEPNLTLCGPYPTP